MLRRVGADIVLLKGHTPEEVTRIAKFTAYKPTILDLGTADSDALLIKKGVPFIVQTKITGKLSMLNSKPIATVTYKNNKTPILIALPPEKSEWPKFNPSFPALLIVSGMLGIDLNDQKAPGALWLANLTDVTFVTAVATDDMCEKRFYGILTRGLKHYGSGDYSPPGGPTIRWARLSI
jgi:hypothetical protein